MFAKIYDALMADVDYEAICQWLKPHLRINDLVLDAGCGSGFLLVELMKNGYDTFGFDQDTAMLSLAYDKLRIGELPIRLFEHDMRNPFHLEVDVVLAMFDVMNYFKGIKKVIQNIHDALSDEGRFIFDVYKEDVLITYDNFVESENEPMPYVWKIKVKNKMLKHTVETNQQQDVIYQYVHPLTYVVSILEEIGFHAEIHTGPDSRKYYIIAFK